jgi:hypothetical protein
MGRIAVAAGCAVAVLAWMNLVALDQPPARTAGPCAVVNGPATLPGIQEASGLAISRRHPGVIWSHNDSGNDAVLFALDAKGAIVGRVRVPVGARDWEDVSAARCPSGPCLYVADIGDNSVSRRRIQIYRVPEPAPSDAETARPEVLAATYVDGSHNAEAMFVIGAELFVVTKDRTGAVYRSTASSPGGGDLTFRRIGQLGLEMVTDAEASPDEKSVAVRTEREVVLYRAADLVDGHVNPYARIPLGDLKEPQGEGVALDDTGTLYLASEGRGWGRPGSFLSLRCTLP